MKTYTLLVVMIATVGLVGCKKKAAPEGKGGTVAVKKESKKLECDKKYKPTKFKDGQVKYCTLAEDYTVGGITCKKGQHIELNPENRKLYRCTLAMPQTVDGHKCAAEQVEFHWSGKLSSCHLQSPKKYNGVLCKGKTGFQRKGGTLNYCDLAENTVIQGFPCKADTASFDEKGKLYLCYAAKEITAGGAKLSSGTKIQPFGGPRIEYAETMRGSTITFNAYQCSEMHFQKSGEPKKCKLAATVKIGDKDIPAKKWVCFDKSGKAVSGSGCVSL
jgi:hypothetical protein